MNYVELSFLVFLLHDLEYEILLKELGYLEDTIQYQYLPDSDCKGIEDFEKEYPGKGEIAETLYKTLRQHKLVDIHVKMWE